MTLLEELAKNKEIRIDFHNHGQTGSPFRKKQKGLKNKVKGLFLSEGFSDLSKVLDRLYKSGISILYVTNFSDSRYEDWTSKEQIEIAKKVGYQIEQGEYYTFAKKDGKIVVVGKSQEVPTTQGHMLFAGIKKGKKFSDNKSLDDTLKEATDGELKIADHPFCGVRGQNGVIAYSKNRDVDAKKVDAFERNGNFYLPFSFANHKAIRYSGKHNIPLVSDADGHHPKDIGKCYNIFKPESLKYNSERAFRDSINNAVRENNFETHYHPIPIYRIFHHVMMIVLNKVLNKKEWQKG
jgi:PHP-associated